MASSKKKKKKKTSSTMASSEKKRKAPPAAAAGLPPRGGVQKGKKIVDTLVVAASDGGLPRTRSKVRTEAASPSPAVTAVISEPLLKKLRNAQEEYWDHVHEMKNAKDCIDHGRFMVSRRRSKNKKECWIRPFFLKSTQKLRKQSLDTTPWY